MLLSQFNRNYQQLEQKAVRFASRNFACQSSQFTSSQGLPAVVFDLGKVLLEYDFDIASRGIANASKNKIDQQLVAAAFHSEDITKKIGLDGSMCLVERLERGQMSEQEFHEVVVWCTGAGIARNDFDEIYQNIFTPIQEMIDCQQSLLKNKVPTFVLSNCSSLQIKKIKLKYKFFNDFDGCVLSFEHKCYKPDQLIYEIAQELIGKDAQDIYFLDDKRENVEAAKHCGWNAHQHISPLHSKQWLLSHNLMYQ